MPRSHGTHRSLPPYDLAVRAAAGQELFHDPALRERIQSYKAPAAFPDFCKDLLKIRTKQAEMVPFVLNRAQRSLWTQDIQPALETGKPVWFYLLKARQLGWTTVFQAAKYWRTTLWPDVHAFTAAHEDKSVRKIFGISKLFYRLAPPDFRPEQKTSNRIELHFANPSDVGDLGLESYLTVAPATNENLGASQTLQFAHLSEFALYDQRSLDVEAMLATFFQTIASAPLSMVILETTARPGYGEEYWYGDNRFRKRFVSWIADDAYTDDIPVPDESILREGKYGDEIRAREAIAEELRIWYPEAAPDAAWVRHESAKRLGWRRTKIDEQVRAGGLSFFRREYPLSPDEAFSTSSTGVFDSQILYDCKARAESRLVRAEPGLEAWTRVRRFFPRPLADQLHAQGGLANLQGLLTYEKPIPGARYTMGADPGGGHVDGDPSAVQVLRMGEGSLLGAFFQAAVFRGQVGAVDLAYLVGDLGMRYNLAMVVPEATGLGHGLVDELVHRVGYPNVFRRLVVDEGQEEVNEKLGFATSQSTKPYIVSLLQDAIAGGALMLRDLATIQELLIFSAETRGRSIAYGAPKGKHDDLAMALALAVFGAREVPAPSKPKAKDDRWWERPPSLVGLAPRRGFQEAPASMF
jgi:hypothetical protein